MRKPKESDSFNSDRTCIDCAWTSLGNMHEGVFCYRYHELFPFEYQHTTAIGMQLKMKPCPSFHSLLRDIKRGHEFATYIQNRGQIRAVSFRSWISIAISALALFVSAYTIWRNR